MPEGSTVAKRRPRKTVAVRPISYQLSKVDLEKPLKDRRHPEELARAVLQPARVAKDPSA